MREALKTRISKYGPKTDASMTVENVQGKGLQLVVIYAGRKHYLPLSSVPLNPDEHANHPNHQKIKVDHSGSVGIGTPTPVEKLHLYGTSDMDIRMEMVSDSDSNRIQFYRAKVGPALVTDNQDMGSISAYGHDGTNYEQASQIIFEVDGTAEDNIMPGRIAFLTTTTNLLLERMRINSAGNVGIGTAAGTVDAQLHVDQNSASGAKPCLELDQNDQDEPFIEFDGTASSGDSNSLSTSTTEGSSLKVGAIRVSINGTDRWIWLYSTHGPAP